MFVNVHIYICACLQSHSALLWRIIIAFLRLIKLLILQKQTPIEKTLLMQQQQYQKQIFIAFPVLKKYFEQSQSYKAHICLSCLMKFVSVFVIK